MLKMAQGISNGSLNILFRLAYFRQLGGSLPDISPYDVKLQICTCSNILQIFFFIFLFLLHFPSQTYLSVVHVVCSIHFSRRIST
jgi:hypothetical protein